MSTIDKLMEGKKPGEVKIRRLSWECGYFQPFYKIDDSWHGLRINGSRTYSTACLSPTLDWELYQESSKKVKKWLWVDVKGYMTEEEACQRSGNLKALKGTEIDAEESE